MHLIHMSSHGSLGPGILLCGEEVLQRLTLLDRLLELLPSHQMLRVRVWEGESWGKVLSALLRHLQGEHVVLEMLDQLLPELVGPVDVVGIELLFHARRLGSGSRVTGTESGWAGHVLRLS